MTDLGLRVLAILAARGIVPQSHEIPVQDDGSGSKIVRWPTRFGLEPTEAELLAADIETPSRREQLRASDAGMARVAEDVAVALLTGAPISQADKDKINARRRLRGEATIP